MFFCFSDNIATQTISMEKKNASGVKEIARRANVSIATVDRVLHKRPGVAPKTLKKIKAIIKELNYRPNLLARRLASGKKLHFLAIVPKLPAETAYWEALTKGIDKAEAEISQYGVTISRFLFDANDRSSFVQQCEAALKVPCDGILITPLFIEESKKFCAACKRKKTPFVFVNSDIPDVNSLCYIGPDLYHSGYLVAHLSSYLVKQKGKVLIVNISKQIENHHHILRKEEGFREYFKSDKNGFEIIQLNILDTRFITIEKELNQVLNSHPDIQLIFVTNSRVSEVAKYFDKKKKNKTILIGYDFLPINLQFLKKNIIDFLICQKPQEQGYQGILTLYRLMSFDTPIEKVRFMPIDIVTRENYMFYND